MAEIVVNTAYMEHTGGTKFYEVVMLSPALARGGPSILIKRYGKLDHKKIGGQRRVERGTEFEIKKSFGSIINQKSKRGYERASGLLGFGLHAHHARQVDSAKLGAIASLHYGKNSEEAIAIIDAMCAGTSIAATAALVEPEVEIEVEIDRGVEWGMF